MSKKQELASWIKTLVFAVVIALIIRTFLFTNYIVEGESMMPTMHDGDRLIVNKIAYKLDKPERFDIVVFHVDRGADYIKRVIGLPGDEIAYRNDTLYVNGEPVEEPYLEDYKEEVGNRLLTENFTLDEIIGQKTVPENTVFVLGDNRMNSTDSRMIGVVPISQIVGEVNIKYWPLSDFRFFH